MWRALFVRNNMASQYTYNDFIEEVKALVQDASGLTKGNKEIIRAIEAARRLHSHWKNITKVQEYTSDGNRVFALPTLWEEGYSDGGVTVEYPVDSGEEQVQYLPDNLIELYQTPTGMMLRFRATTNADDFPGAGEKFRVHFPVTFKIDSEVNELPDIDFIPFNDLASARLCMVLGTRYAQVASTMNGTQATVDYKSKSDMFLKYRDAFLESYQLAIFGDPNKQKAAMVFGTFLVDDYHREQRGAYPLDGSGRMRVDI